MKLVPSFEEIANTIYFIIDFVKDLYNFNVRHARYYYSDFNKSILQLKE